MTMTSIVTHGYSPIEQYQTKGRMGPWTDIYALGAVMCRAMTGEKPPVAADRIVEEDFQWVSHRRLGGFSEKFLNSVDWALRVKAEDRPQALGPWKSALQGQVLESNPVQEQPVRIYKESSGGRGLEDMVHISNTAHLCHDAVIYNAGDLGHYNEVKKNSEHGISARKKESTIVDWAIVLGITCVAFAIIGFISLSLE